MLRQQILDFIDDNLGSPALTPTTIAEAHYISLRHLHTLFSEVDSTVSTWIRERRLERCSEDLLDPLKRDVKIAAVAAHWGFPDAAHFSRLFKRRFGQSPSELRTH